MAQYNLFDKKNSQQIDIAAYLDRIACNRSIKPTLKFLRELHRNHLYQIPFENLSIHLKQQIILDVQRIFNKVIIQKRGGFCYELNGLFLHLLKQLGYYVKIISARVYAENGEIGDEFDHMALIVYIDEKEWLVDVGFGELFLAPIEFKVDNVQMDGNRYFKIIETPDQKFILQSSNDGLIFENEYIFTRKERQYIEFVDKCEYHQTSPKSIFTRKMLVTKATKLGRITLTNKKLVIKNLGEKTEEAILNVDDFQVKLLQHFQIKMVST
jgi:N-hydroxyarylamine O-acetyltransferase